MISLKSVTTREVPINSPGEQVNKQSVCLEAENYSIGNPMTKIQTSHWIIVGMSGILNWWPWSYWILVF